MQTLAIRLAPLVFLAGLVIAVAVVGLGTQSNVLQTHSGAVPDVPCPVGVSPAQSFCFVTEPPGSPQASKMPDTEVPPPSTHAPTSP